MKIGKYTTEKARLEWHKDVVMGVKQGCGDGNYKDIVCCFEWIPEAVPNILQSIQDEQNMQEK